MLWERDVLWELLPWYSNRTADCHRLDTDYLVLYRALSYDQKVGMLEALPMLPFQGLLFE